MFAARCHWPPLDPQNFQSSRGRPLVMMNHVVQFELIDLAGLELGEAGTHTLKQHSQLILVVRGDQLSTRAAIGFLS